MKLFLKYLLRFGVAAIALLFGHVQPAIAQFDPVGQQWTGQNLSQAARTVVADGKAESRDRLIVPANTTAGLELHSIINSRTAYPGQMIYCTTMYPITADDRIVIPAGSFVRGRIRWGVTPKRLKGKRRCDGI